MFKKILTDATKKVNTAAHSSGLRDKLSDIVGDAPLPLSGLLGASSGRQPKVSKSQIRHEASLPRASIRDDALESQIIEAASSSDLLSDLRVMSCILPNSSWVPDRDDETSPGLMKARWRSVFIVGKDENDQNIVRDAVVAQLAPSGSRAEQVDDDSLFIDASLSVSAISDVTYIVPDEAVQRGVEMRRRRVLTPITIHNGLSRRIKVQSLDAQNDDFEEITIRAGETRVFNYLDAAETFSVRDAETSRLISSHDPKSPGFGMSVLEI